MQPVAEGKAHTAVCLRSVITYRVPYIRCVIAVFVLLQNILIIVNTQPCTAHNLTKKLTTHLFMFTDYVYHANYIRSSMRVQRTASTKLISICLSVVFRSLMLMEMEVGWLSMQVCLCYVRGFWYAQQQQMMTHHSWCLAGFTVEGERYLNVCKYALENKKNIYSCIFEM